MCDSVPKITAEFKSGGSIDGTKSIYIGLCVLQNCRLPAANQKCQNTKGVLQCQ